MKRLINSDLCFATRAPVAVLDGAQSDFTRKRVSALTGVRREVRLMRWSAAMLMKSLGSASAIASFGVGTAG
ncbi:hypothetical protein G5B38_06770 [Pseudohalocynthiibacter aestuariivivens]|nr:hypothetical protein [Pseudohalocynthiibacter aestuariivivens]QIE45250.1 hypothetical protein G5B38_06770 [Pseudohalocynthiibacter aestuariivivens]